jgi:catechol 2,3-dioxygenase-like lactoylglutathione lyase family enzyme
MEHPKSAINIKRPDHIYVPVPPEKVHEAHEFYTNVMGFEPMERPAVFDQTVGYWYRMAGIEFHIGTEDATSKSRRHFALEVTGLQAAREHLQAHGVAIEDPEIIPGRQRFMFTDPYGNMMELLEYD